MYNTASTAYILKAFFLAYGEWNRVVELGQYKNWDQLIKLTWYLRSGKHTLDIYCGVVFWRYRSELPSAEVWIKFATLLPPCSIMELQKHSGMGNEERLSFSNHFPFS